MLRHEYEREAAKAADKQLDAVLDRKVQVELDRQLPAAIEKQVGKSLLDILPWAAGGGGGLYGIYATAKRKRKKSDENE
jgi:hypothetical protein